ncbi:peptidyl-prolyl cis-trans isomerase [Clostridium sp. MD294]|uniref:peptidyl-prolyl cis-trans isomerase n=1 Tax=Clostridium sp. MD294 TaxID=97138 RepID=UPI0002CA8E19|nr:peptidyl-prolyl cis-trans isomerase [Clostridium sp. MD294]NDO47330.1 hypothetical protein [Clostridium sp. MD294]USF29602.1 Foldase protein PrsA [Clostridium sp. MD294]
MKKLKSILAMLLCFLLFAVTGCSKQIDSENIIATVDGKAISKSEYMLYLYEATKDFNEIGGNDIWETDFDGQSAENVVKERAFTTMLHVKVTAEKAGKYKVSLSEQDKSAAKQEGDTELASMTEQQKNIISISQQDIYRIMEDTSLYRKVVEAVTKDYQLSEADFNAYFEQNKEAQRTAYTQYTINTILLPDQQTAQEVSQRLNQGEDFQTVSQIYETNSTQKEKEFAGTIEVYKNKLDTILNMDFYFEQGQITDPISTEEGYYIIRIEQKSVPDDAQLKEMIKAEYTASMKQQVFTDELNQWLSDAEVERNDSVWNSIEMIP